MFEQRARRSVAVSGSDSQRDGFNRRFWAYRDEEEGKTCVVVIRLLAELWGVFLRF